MQQVFFTFLLFSSLLFAKVPSPGNPKAPKGGRIVVSAAMYPKTLFYYLGNEDLVQGISEYVFDPLVSMSLVTYEPVPRIAKSWNISSDKLTYTFTLDERAKFFDGTPVTADDVKFTWDAIMNPNHKTGALQSLFEVFSSVEVESAKSVVFRAKRKNYQSLDLLSQFFVLPKHIYSKGDFNRDFNTKLVGSGPYSLGEVVQGEKIVLKRNPSYWGQDLLDNIGRYNFDEIVFKCHSDPIVMHEIFKKGELDLFRIQMSKMWTLDTVGPLYDSGKVKKLKLENSIPQSVQGIAWNIRRPLFKDKRVRLALSHLMNREKMIQELFYNNYVSTTGPNAINTEYHSPSAKPIAYDLKKAQELLKAAGWVGVGSDGVLVNRANQRFEFDLLANSPAYIRFLTPYQDELKRVGIKMNIRQMEWGTAIKIRDEFNFDAFVTAYTRDVNPFGFNRMWGSDSAKRNGSDNFAGYENPEVDKLAAQIDAEFDKKKRVKLIQKIDKMIGDDVPWTWGWELTYDRVVYWNRFKFDKEFLPYSVWRNVFDYWWSASASIEGNTKK